MSTHDAGLAGLSQHNRKALQANIANFYIASGNIKHETIVQMAVKWFNVEQSYVLAALRNFNCLSHAPQANMDPKRAEILAQSKREGWSITDTGIELGVSKERARQLLNKFYYIEEDNPRITHRHAIEKLQISRSVLLRALLECELEHGLRMADLKKLEPIVARLVAEKRCLRCNNQILYRNKWCSPHCATMHRYDNRMAGTRLTALAKQIKAGPTGEWMRLSAAARKFGFTNAQISYYAHYGVLRTRKNPKRLWRGKPTKLYAANDLRGLKKHLRKSRRPSTRKTRRAA